MNRILTAACFCLLAAFNTAWADSFKELSLDDALRMALSENPSLKQAQEGLASSLSDLRISTVETQSWYGADARLERTPGYTGAPGRVLAGISYANTSGTSASVDVAPIGVGNRRGSVGLDIRHPLMRGAGPLSAKSDLVKSAVLQTGIKDKELYLTRQFTVRDVIQAYYRAVLTRELVTVQDRAVRIAEEAAEDARKRESEGLVVAIDVSRAELRVARTRDTLNRQQQDARAAMDRLMLAIGSGVGEVRELTDPLPDADIQTPAARDAIRAAFVNRAELQIQDDRIADQERRIEMAADELRPALDLVAGFSSIAGHTIASTSLWDQGSLTLGMEYRVPLDRRIITERRETSVRQRDLLQELRDYKTEEIAEQVWGAYRSIEAARTSLSIQTDNLKVAEDNLNLAQRMVDEGLQDNRNVLEAQDSLIGLESGILNARTQLFLAAVDLRYYMGEDLTQIWAK